MSQKGDRGSLPGEQPSAVPGHRPCPPEAASHGGILLPPAWNASHPSSNTAAGRKFNGGDMLHIHKSPVSRLATLSSSNDKSGARNTSEHRSVIASHDHIVTVGHDTCRKNTGASYLTLAL
ncbi:hypothetical protein DPEC_G00182480 [Dallia pectoralis]|uniref:Uncharacterized protein n=1 Tax=Dallia pectoralis TaxID=75939 RepID=A0ACC2GAM5_DALPE|nr:hypothetical protein DPEC_G00182480 [Dallia pectoralis]